MLVVEILDWPAMFAGSHFASRISEIGFTLVISPARVMILGVRQDFANEQTQFSSWPFRLAQRNWQDPHERRKGAFL